MDYTKNQSQMPLADAVGSRQTSLLQKEGMREVSRKKDASDELQLVEDFLSIGPLNDSPAGQLAYTVLLTWHSAQPMTLDVLAATQLDLIQRFGRGMGEDPEIHMQAVVQGLHHKFGGLGNYSTDAVSKIFSEQNFEIQPTNDAIVSSGDQVLELVQDLVHDLVVEQDVEEARAGLEAECYRLACLWRDSNPSDSNEEVAAMGFEIMMAQLEREQELCDLQLEQESISDQKENLPTGINLPDDTGCTEQIQAEVKQPANMMAAQDTHGQQVQSERPEVRPQHYPDQPLSQRWGAKRPGRLKRMK